MTDTAAQLGLPFDAETLQTWVDSAGSLELHISLTRSGARLRLIGPWPEGEEPTRGLIWQAEVDVTRPARARASAQPDGDSRLAFASDLPFDWLAAPLRWAAEVMRRRQIQEHGLLLAIRRSLVLVARHLEGLLDERARATARLFPESMRWFVYEAAANDPTGRLADLARRCPDLFTLCGELHERGAAREARQILAGAAAGRPLGRLLSLATRVRVVVDGRWSAQSTR